LLDRDPEPWPGEEDLGPELLKPGARGKNHLPSAAPGPVSRLKKGGPVPGRTETVNQALEEVRVYLETLTFIQIDPRLRSKFGLSDVVQNTLVKAWGDLDRIRGLGPDGRKRWLRRMLVNTMLDEIEHWRTKGRDVLREQSLEAAAEESSCRLQSWLATEDTSPSERLAAEEDKERLLEALSQLPRREREALILQQYHGWKLAQIAEHLECTTNAVAGLQAHGRARLRELLENWE
jgi:RNA polymerase sigma-70 factor (subfamily 1)